MTVKKQTMPLKKGISRKQASSAGSTPAFLQRNRELFLLGVVIVVTLFIYLPALNHRFTNWDDNDYITDNPYIKTLSPANLHYIFTKPIALNYHPLTMLSLALNYRVSGSEPFSYFMVNIIFHLLNTLLVFYLGCRLFAPERIPALFVAALFAVHPMHVESVAWISERKDVLYAFFFLAALVSWIFYINRRKWFWYLISLLLFALSGLSKPSAVVFPGILFLVDYFFKRRMSILAAAEKIPFVAISIAIGLATLSAQLHTAVADLQHYNFIQQFLFASYGFFIYILKLVIPYGLSALHPVPVFNTSLDLPWIYFAAPLFDLVIIGAVIWSIRYSRVIVVCFGFYLLNIILTLQFMQVGSAVAAERYTYVAYIGLLAGMAWILGEMINREILRKTWVYPALILFFITMSVMAGQRVAVWKNSGTLWSDVIEKYPASYTAYNNRGYYYVQEKMYDKALPDFTKALDLQPGFVDALNNRGSLYRLQNMPRQAIADYNRALAKNPDYVKALTGRGNAYDMLNKPDSALADLDRAYALNPTLAMSLGDRGSLLFRLGRFDSAVEDCTRKIALYPDNTAAYLNRAVAYSSLKKWDEAISDYSFVLRTSADNPSIFEWRGVAYRSIGSFQPAISDFTSAISLDPGKSSLFINRAMALQQAGMTDKALEDLKMARHLGAQVSDQQIILSSSLPEKKTKR